MVIGSCIGFLSLRVFDAEGAVRSAIGEFRRYARRMRLKELSGEVMMEDNWRVMEDSETDAPGSR